MLGFKYRGAHRLDNSSSLPTLGMQNPSCLRRRSGQEAPCGSAARVAEPTEGLTIVRERLGVRRRQRDVDLHRFIFQMTAAVERRGAVRRTFALPNIPKSIRAWPSGCPLQRYDLVGLDRTSVHQTVSSPLLAPTSLRIGLFCNCR